MGSSSPQGGSQIPAGGIPASPITVVGTGGPISPVNPSPSTNSIVSTGTASITDDSAGDVLQASTTVTSLAVALIALFPSTSLAKMTVMTVGHWSLPLGIAVLTCGIVALLSSVFSLDKLRRKAGLSGFSMVFTHIGLLFIALFLFLLIYLGVAATYVF